MHTLMECHLHMYFEFVSSSTDKASSEGHCTSRWPSWSRAVIATLFSSWDPAQRAARRCSSQSETSPAADDQWTCTALTLFMVVPHLQLPLTDCTICVHQVSGQWRSGKCAAQ